MTSRDFIKVLNNIIHITERILAFLLDFIWIPGFIKPPHGEAVTFLTDKYFVLPGHYTEGQYKYYPAKYDRALAWKFRYGIPLPRIPLPSVASQWRVDVLFSPKSDHVWEYVDGAGEKHFVSANTRRAMEKNPFHTTVSDKNEKLQKSTEKAREQRFDKIKQIKGNSL